MNNLRVLLHGQIQQGKHGDMVTTLAGDWVWLRRQRIVLEEARKRLGETRIANGAKQLAIARRTNKLLEPDQFKLHKWINVNTKVRMRRLAMYETHVKQNASPIEDEPVYRYLIRKEHFDFNWKPAESRLVRCITRILLKGETEFLRALADAFDALSKRRDEIRDPIRFEILSFAGADWRFHGPIAEAPVASPCRHTFRKLLEHLDKKFPDRDGMDEGQIRKMCKELGVTFQRDKPGPRPK